MRMVHVCEEGAWSSIQRPCRDCEGHVCANMIVKTNNASFAERFSNLCCKKRKASLMKISRNYRMLLKNAKTSTNTMFKRSEHGNWSWWKCLKEKSVLVYKSGWHKLFLQKTQCNSFITINLLLLYSVFCVCWQVHVQRNCTDITLTNPLLLLTLAPCFTKHWTSSRLPSPQALCSSSSCSTQINITDMWSYALHYNVHSLDYKQLHILGISRLVSPPVSRMCACYYVRG